MIFAMCTDLLLKIYLRAKTTLRPWVRLLVPATLMTILVLGFTSAPSASAYDAVESTQIKLPAGLVKPESDTVMRDGLELQHNVADRRNECIGYLPQQCRLCNKTMRDNLMLGLSAMVEVPTRKRTLCSHLSKSITKTLNQSMEKR